jgi:hypothetical protein
VELAHARSGDKGDRADIGVFARTPAHYEILKREVTTERVAAHFGDLGCTAVRRYDLDNLLALKFVLETALQGGGARSLRSDNLGKTLAARLLRMSIEL